MVDRHFTDSDLAARYDVLHPWDERDDLAFYLPLVMSAEAVLDVGCGTGILLRRARERGHGGHLCGLDPAVGMLAQARVRSDIDWVLGDVCTTTWERRFDLVVMTGHAFQVLITDDDIRAALAAVRSALVDDGRFVFETRNPPARAWREWTPEHAVEKPDTTGAVVRMEHRVVMPVEGDLVRFITTYTGARWSRPQVSHSTLRFLDVDALSDFLSEAGLVIDEQCGDWAGQPLTDTSPEIITVARAGYFPAIS